MKKEKGLSNYIYMFFPLLIIFPVLTIAFEIYAATSIKYESQDYLIASLMASALVDADEYSEDGYLTIKDKDLSYNVFIDCIKENLDVNDDMTFQNDEIYVGHLFIEEYIIYNVRGQEVTIHNVTEGVTEVKTLNDTYSPNGIKIEETSIYGKISYPILIFFNMEIEINTENIISVTNT